LIWNPLVLSVLKTRISYFNLFTWLNVYPPPRRVRILLFAPMIYYYFPLLLCNLLIFTFLISGLPSTLAFIDLCVFELAVHGICYNFCSWNMFFHPLWSCIHMWGISRSGWCKSKWEKGNSSPCPTNIKVVNKNFQSLVGPPKIFKLPIKCHIFESHFNFHRLDKRIN